MRFNRLVWFLLLCLMAVPRAHASEPLLVFAPASMTDVLNDLADAYEKHSSQQLVLSFAGTPQLARQLDAGAPAHLFVSADREWMKWVADRDLAAPQDVFALAGNQLVVAVRREVENWADLDGLLSENRFAMAEPEFVPAGRYARQALIQRGIWQAASTQAVYGDNVRTTLRRLARGEVAAAIVYETDSAIEPNVRTLFTFPAGSHEPIVYWATPVGEDRSAETARLIEFLRGGEASAIMAKAGFTTAPNTPFSQLGDGQE